MSIAFKLSKKLVIKSSNDTNIPISISISINWCFKVYIRK